MQKLRLLISTEDILEEACTPRHEIDVDTPGSNSPRLQCVPRVFLYEPSARTPFLDVMQFCLAGGFLCPLLLAEVLKGLCSYIFEGEIVAPNVELKIISQHYFLEYPKTREVRISHKTGKCTPLWVPRFRELSGEHFFRGQIVHLPAIHDFSNHVHSKRSIKSIS